MTIYFINNLTIKTEEKKRRKKGKNRQSLNIVGKLEFFYKRKTANYSKLITVY